MANILDRFMIRGLTEGANAVVTNARRNASWSTTIPEAIEAGDAVVTPTGYEVSVKLNLKKAPQAAAFEFGSGIHATRGPKQPYIIRPREKSSLAIPFERWPDFEPPVIAGPKMIGEGDKGYLLRYVEHPGVEARPFITPALQDYKPAFKLRILNALRFGLRSQVAKKVEILG